jgi:hypothetical protein
MVFSPDLKSSKIKEFLFMLYMEGYLPETIEKFKTIYIGIEIINYYVSCFLKRRI